MRVRLVLVVGASALLVSCTGAESSPPDVPEPSTLSPAPDIGNNVSARDATRDGGFVMQAGLAGTLRVSPRGCLYAYVPKTPPSDRVFRTDLVWPRGTRVALDESGTPVIVRYDGVVVAKVGHSLRGLGGGSVAVRRATDITCRVHKVGDVFYIQGEMPPLEAPL
jgi:hypothetical protein